MLQRIGNIVVGEVFLNNLFVFVQEENDRDGAKVKQLLAFDFALVVPAVQPLRIGLRGEVASPKRLIVLEIEGDNFQLAAVYRLCEFWVSAQLLTYCRAGMAVGVMQVQQGVFCVNALQS